MDPPLYVDLKSQPATQANVLLDQSRNINDVNCGPASLAQAMQILDPEGINLSPTTRHLSEYLSTRGLMYDWGTGVEELAYAAREFGYGGSIPFQNWNIEQLTDYLRQGRPVVVSLGLNGADNPGHFVTLTGISKDGNWLNYQDPVAGELILSKKEFLSLWQMQGSAGMIPQKGSSAMLADPMLPWMGLFGAISALALTLNQSAGWRESRAFSLLRKQMSNPRRKGIGGGPLPPKEPEVIRVPRYETKTVYRGINTVEMEVPFYETRKVKVGFRGIKNKVPQYETRRVQVGVESVTKRAPIYGTKKIQTGTRFVKKEIPVTRYKTKKVMVWKKYTKRVPVYRNIGSKRFIIDYKNETRWKRVPVTKQVPYKTTKTISIQVPVYKAVRVVSGYKTVNEMVPKFEEKQVLVGHKIINETVPVFEDRQVQVGTKTVTRQMPEYETVRVVTGYDEIPLHQQQLDTVEQKMKSICEDAELLNLVGERDFEVTNVVYLKGGPGAGLGMEKVENSWSGFYGGGGGGSTPWMLLLKLASRALVWVRDSTNLLEGPGWNPDAQAIILYSSHGNDKKIDEIVVINKGNETISIESINLGSVNINSSREKDIVEIYPNPNVGIGHQDKQSIESGSFQTILVNPHFHILPNTYNTIYIKLTSNSKRAGFLIHEFQKDN